jgi:hypothetical protein
MGSLVDSLGIHILLFIVQCVINILVETLIVFTLTLSHMKGNVMLQKFIDLVKSIFAPADYGSELERFIISHNPQNTAHIEALERQFDSLRTKQSSFIWSRGL